MRDCLSLPSTRMLLATQANDLAACESQGKLQILYNLLKIIHSNFKRAIQIINNAMIVENDEPRRRRIIVGTYLKVFKFLLYLVESSIPDSTQNSLD